MICLNVYLHRIYQHLIFREIVIKLEKGKVLLWKRGKN